MLKTCLKYDFRAIRKFATLEYLLILGTGVFGGLCIRMFTVLQAREETVFHIISGFCMIGTMIAVMCMIVTAAAGFLSGFIDFYQKFFTDQGYLTFTLPVRRSTLYLSKVIVGTLNQLITLVLLFVSICLFALIAPGFKEGLSELWGILGEIPALGAEPLLLILPILVLIVALLLFSNGLFYMCIVIGCTQVKKFKLAATIGICYLGSSVVSAVSTVALIPLIISAVVMLDAMILVGGTATWWMLSATIMVAAMVVGCLAAVFHYIAVAMIEKKINLA